MPDYLHLLKSYWGYPQFRPMQREIIESVGAGRDTLGLLPTGGGKSVTFQVPALSLPGLCLVITPLVALMKDQVEQLRHKDIKAVCIYSGMSYEEVQSAFNYCLYGNCKFLYISPERLGTQLFLEKIRYLKVSLIAVDESHCISQWGYDFRPAYRQISNIRLHLPGVPVLALTATATPDVVTDIQRQLLFPAENVFKTSFARKNLIYVVRQTDDKEGQLLRILKGVAGSSVVYVRSRQKTKEVADFLNRQHITADYFHAGLNNADKDRKQAGWKANAIRVMVATNAFGMGIDKPDVRTVIHLDLPDCIEAYFQEAGRAGRDGKTSYAVLLYNKADLTKAKKRVNDNFPPVDFIKRVYECVGFYYQVGVDCGEGRMFAFDLFDFCRKFKLPQLPAHHALKILSLSGYLDYTDEVQTLPRVR
ncbi:MAG: ATP-dependent DNA helicase RecQ, partial [Paludibacteraceae bacterium]|nr:ATP-dependent DNA helicase RecQ [Paludibacteraceae bacterium]